MTKPKIICIAGSAVLAPVAMFAILLSIALVIMLLGIDHTWWWKFQLPSWVLWPMRIVCWGYLGFTCVRIYKWFFRKCYTPQMNREGVK